VLREYQLAISDHVEHTIVALDQFCVDAQLIRDLGRQTGGLGVIVSANAVGDFDLHRFHPWEAIALV